MAAIAALEGTPVDLTLAGREVDDGHRLFDNVQIKASPLKGDVFILHVTQLLIPTSVFGRTSLATEYVGLFRSHELIDIRHAVSRYPVRRTYPGTEMFRYAGHGERLTLIRAAVGSPIETGTVYRDVVIHMDTEESDLVQVSRVLETKPNPYSRKTLSKVHRLGKVPLAEIAFAMQVVVA
jgi:hypothetical protein